MSEYGKAWQQMADIRAELQRIDHGADTSTLASAINSFKDNRESGKAQLLLRRWTALEAEAKKLDPITGNLSTTPGPQSISYSERELFKPNEIALWRRATELVARIPQSLKDSRCHEIARACGKLLDLPVQDGLYGCIDHSWLWTHPVVRTVGRIGFPHILDVYCVGSLPMVRLVDGEHVGWAYRPGDMREDIDEGRVIDLVWTMRGDNV